MFRTISCRSQSEHEAQQCFAVVKVNMHMAPGVDGNDVTFGCLDVEGGEHRPDCPHRCNSNQDKHGRQSISKHHYRVQMTGSSQSDSPAMPRVSGQVDPSSSSAAHFKRARARLRLNLRLRPLMNVSTLETEQTETFTTGLPLLLTPASLIAPRHLHNNPHTTTSQPSTCSRDTGASRACRARSSGTD